MSHHAFRPGSPASWLLILAVTGLVLSGCGGSADSDPPDAGAKKEWSVVAIGDSIPLAGPECDDCASFVDRWAKELAKKTGRRVTASNHAVADAEASDVLSQVQEDDLTRSALTDADLVVIDVGINDSPWNRTDDPCKAAPEYPVIQWKKITPACTTRVLDDYEKTMEKILEEVESLRAGKPTALRLVNVYNAVLGDHVDPSWDSKAAVRPSIDANDRFADLQCRLVETHDGLCADAYQVLNGSDGSRAADRFLAPDHTHLSAAGHEAVAQLLVDLGPDPSS